MNIPESQSGELEATTALAESAIQRLLAESEAAAEIEKKVIAPVQGYIIARLCDEGFLQNEADYVMKGYATAFRAFWDGSLGASQETIASYTIARMRADGVASGLKDVYEKFLPYALVERAA